jgi:hypothetical protein
VQISKVLTELRKTRELVADTIAAVEWVAQEREEQRWVTACTKKTAGPKRGAVKDQRRRRGE